MRAPTIKLERISKSYLIEKGLNRGDGLRHAVDAAVLHPIQWLRRRAARDREEFWALQEVSFAVNHGEVVGIIGRNGAGKSTLLKVLSRITEPTHGRVTIRGRAASLLEVGTGFHPELSGRENIFLNGAILGMTRVEVKRKFDEIVAFSGVERFLDTPVKRYSSGMYVRLAFAVAAHLEPEILLVDEVLAVGDSEFQKKCLGKMGEVAREGRTVLFVSHQLGAVSALCSRVLVLDRGRVVVDGATAPAIGTYLTKEQQASHGPDAVSALPRSGNGRVRIERFWVTGADYRDQSTVVSGQTVVFNFLLRRHDVAPVRNVSVGFSVHDHLDARLSILYSDYGGSPFLMDRTCATVRCVIPRFPFSSGRYILRVRAVADGEESDWPDGLAVPLDVEAGAYYPSGGRFHGGIGAVLLDGQWSLD